MAAKLEEMVFDVDEIVRMDIDLELGQGTIGLFTADLTTSPYVTMGHIRKMIGEALGLTQEDFTIKNDKTVVPDTYIARNYLDDIKDLYNGNLLSLDIAEEKQKLVAQSLQKRIKEDKEIQDMGRSVVIEQLCEDRNITLTIYKPCFYLYIDKYL